jgi:hypothetical protein
MSHDLFEASNTPKASYRQLLDGLPSVLDRLCEVELGSLQEFGSELSGSESVIPDPSMDEQYGRVVQGLTQVVSEGCLAGHSEVFNAMAQDPRYAPRSLAVTVITVVAEHSIETATALIANAWQYLANGEGFQGDADLISRELRDAVVFALVPDEILANSIKAEADRHIAAKLPISPTPDLELEGQ